MEQVLLVVQVIIAVGLIGMVLIQRSDSDGFGLSGGSGNNLMSGRGAATAMTRITAIFAALFIINSLALAVIAAHGHAPSIAETIEQQQADKPALPAVPLAGAEAPKADAKKEADTKPETKPKAEKKTDSEPKVSEETVKEPAKKAKKKVAQFDPNAPAATEE